MNEGYVIWFTGRHGSGKTTISEILSNHLVKMKIPFELFDGDELRKTISSDLGYSIEERNEHMKRVAGLCKSNSEKGKISIASVASPTEKSRKYARSIIKNFILVYVNCPLETAEKRDVKGHYKKAKAKEKGFENFVTGSFEEPSNADIVIQTDKETPEISSKKLIRFLSARKII